MALQQYVYSPIDFAFDCYAAGFRVGKGLTVVVAIAFPETGGTYDPKITNTVGNQPPSTDRGLLQINSFWHAEVTDECAFDPKCTAREGFRISKQGTDFTPWSTFNAGAHLRYMPIAWLAVDAMTRIQQRDQTIATQKQQLADANAKLAAAGQQVATRDQQLQTASSQIADLQTQLAQLTADDQTVAAQLKAAQDALAITKADLATAQAQAAQFHASITAYIEGVQRQLLGDTPPVA